MGYQQEGFHVYWPSSGFPTTLSGPYKTVAEAMQAIDSYTGPEKMKGAAYIMEHKMTYTKVPRAAKVPADA